MLGHFTLHWTSVKKRWKKMEKLCATYVWIYLIASTQGICINRVLVTIWCSNNSPSMKCTHVNFWYPDTVWGHLLQYSVILALFLVCVVLSRNCYACFIVFLFVWFFFAECFWDFVCECLSVCVYSMCAHFVLSLFPLIHNLHDYSAHWTIAVLPNVQRQNTDVYFSCYETCHL